MRHKDRHRSLSDRESDPGQTSMCNASRQREPVAHRVAFLGSQTSGMCAACTSDAATIMRNIKPTIRTAGSHRAAAHFPPERNIPDKAGASAAQYGSLKARLPRQASAKLRIVARSLDPL